MYGKDITKSGTGNVGAMNSYDVTGSKKTGIIVFIIDFMKGFLPALIFHYVLGFSICFVAVPLIFLVVGHNFSVWLKFKGGRGLSASAGISAAISYSYLIVWCLIFILVYKFFKNIHLGNISATILMPVSVYLLRPLLVYIDPRLNTDFLCFFSVICCISLLILIGHINPILKLLKIK